MSTYAESVSDTISVTPVGEIEIWQTRVTLRDGTKMNEAREVSVLKPGDDLTGRDPRVVAIAGVVWTPDVLTAYADRVAAADPLHSAKE